MECDYIGLYDSKHLFYYNSNNVLDIITNTNELFHSISYSSLFDINDASYKVYTISLFLDRVDDVEISNIYMYASNSNNHYFSKYLS